MLVCSNCSENYELVGRSYQRKESNKIDYFCIACKSKLKPVEKFISKFDQLTPERKEEYKRDVNQYRKKRSVENILIVGDLHEPFTLDGYLEFCKSAYDKYACDHTIFIGDIIDNHFSSFHSADPDGFSGGDELDFAIKKIQKWAEVFPEADAVVGNHCAIILRKAFKEGVSKRWIRDFHEVLGVNWNFQPSFEYNNCLFRHGMNMKAAPKSGSEMMNVIQGHFHTDAYIQWNVGRGKKVFGMQVPCGVDRETYAMAYAKEFPKPAIGCAVLLEKGNLPIIEMMNL